MYCACYAAANNTFWNLQTNTGAAIQLPSCEFGPYLFLAGNWSAPADSGSSGDGERRRLLQAGEAGNLLAVAGAPAPEPLDVGSPANGDGAAAPGPVPGLAAPAEDAATAAAPASSQADGSSSRADAASLVTTWCSAQRWRVEQLDPGMQLWPTDLFTAMVAARKAGRSLT